MAISLSVIVLLGVILFVMVRGGSLKAGPAVVAVLFGFFLAATSMAPAIQNTLTSAATALAAIDF
ncbi:hypothetical protein ABZ605_28145 [Streptomyces sp. NPDC012765]|uniref:hypothetical protein n=1 Tax=Streptomyces sp. NPDC012765 TaxID=3155249 RepID=UPI003402BF74